MNKDEEKAKEKLDKLISGSRVHFYKPIQIAEVLYRNRVESLSLHPEENYKNPSKRWRDEVSQTLVGKISTSSDGYQQQLFRQQLPRQDLLSLAKLNRDSGGQVEAYIYRSFQEKVGDVGLIHAYLDQVEPAEFKISRLEQLFSTNPGLRRSMDKLFEILAYGILSAVIEALDVQVSLEIKNESKDVFRHYEDFGEKVLGVNKGNHRTEHAKVFRVGTTNAADGGLDLWASYGPAIQVKNISLSTDQIEKITDAVRADRFIIVCKDVEKSVIQSVLQQSGDFSKVQSIVTFEDISRWYEIAFSEPFRSSIGKKALDSLRQEFDYEFPYSSTASEGTSLARFMDERGYSRITLSREWRLLKQDLIAKFIK